ncbi:MAG: hypothetical protein RDV48_24765 [Candidatus Eremiobacteraeota bacterium]|nr:hypothetical protein [Candidatus Eremiobacteraeota bacterium]
MDEITGLCARVKALEREARLWRISFCIIIALLMCLMVVQCLRPPLAQAQSDTITAGTIKADMVEAQVFEVVGRSDRTVAALAVRPQGYPVLFLYDSRGNVRMELSMKDDKPKITLTDAAMKKQWQAP